MVIEAADIPGLKLLMDKREALGKVDLARRHYHHLKAMGVTGGELHRAWDLWADQAAVMNELIPQGGAE